MIYRIAENPDWLQLQRTGEFASADLAAEGFIHASERAQVLRTARKYYRGKTGLRLLEIDDAMLGELVRREDLTGSGMLFPHIYAPVPRAAITRFFDFAADAAGDFALPPGLAAD